MLLHRLDRDRSARSHFHFKTHDGFVNAADLFHVQRPVAQPFPVEYKQVVEDSIDNAVADAGDGFRVPGFGFQGRLGSGALSRRFPRHLKPDT